MAENTQGDFKGRWWHPEGDRVVCDLCPRRCQIPEGKRGFCFVRQNIGGAMVLSTYGRSTGFCIDPIEKKPLNHFLPGSPVLSFGTAGCNLGCKFCQNWDISKAKETEILSAVATPEAIVRQAIDKGCRSIAFTYNDPVIWAEYALDTAACARQEGIRTVAVTAGYITPEARPKFYRMMDAANVDLKAFSEEFYKKITFGKLDSVLDTLRWLRHESGVWFEITNLMIPDENDSPDETARMCDWIVETLGTDVPIHFTAFHPDYKMLNKPRTNGETLTRARSQAIQAGIKYAYVGNVYGKEEQSTYCPGCSKIVIERDWYQLGDYHIKDGACAFCDTLIAGIFENTAGTWGRNREPIDMTEDAALVHRSHSKPPTRTELDYTPRTEFSGEEGTQLLCYTREIIAAAVQGRSSDTRLEPALGSSPAYGAFVTLKRGSLLRACRGRWGGDKAETIEEIVGSAARDAATFDPRFPSIAPEELPHLMVEVSLMFNPTMLGAKNAGRTAAIEIGRHGLVVIHPTGRGLLLPNVATENGWDARTFLEQACRKANLRTDAWLDDSVEILSFETIRFESDPERPELDIEHATPQLMEGLLNAASELDGRHPGQIAIDRLSAAKIPGEMGIELETGAGLRTASFGVDQSLIELVQSAISSLNALRERAGRDLGSVERVSILTQGVPLKAGDYPSRHLTIGESAVLARSRGKTLLTHPKRGEDPVAASLSALQRTPDEWRDEQAQLTAFRIRAAVRRSKPKSIREPAVSGRFYPGDPQEMMSGVKFFLRSDSPIERRFYPGVMLPHAGWRFCGTIIGRTLLPAAVPQEVIIIGPKHTPRGPRLSIASHDAWDIPGIRVPIATRLRELMTQRIPSFPVEAEAHVEEHGIEVLVPFLRGLQPDLRILPIAVGRCSVEELLSVARVLAEIVALSVQSQQVPPLLVVSSDMNHYAPESETKRKDTLALRSIGDPQSLLKICEREQISMCGVIPVAMVVHALKSIMKNFRAELAGYQTSASATGDTSSVVGYAGVRFGGG